jgi:carbohydrate-selective porin OprB
MDLALGGRRSQHVALVILVILGWAAVAHAEDAPKAPAGTRDLAETPFQLVLPRAHLLGDWLGARTWLEDHGVYPIVTFVTDALGNPTGGKQLGSRTSPSPSPSYRC